MINLRYQIVCKVGEGRSQVFKALDTYTKEYVALKILSKVRPIEEQQLIREEYFVLSKLKHPNIIHAYGYGKVAYCDIDDWTNYRIAESDSLLILEYFDSLSLDNFLDRIDESTLLKIIRKIASVLQYLHNSNLVYSDLKPENILIGNINEPTLKLIDFDLVSAATNNELSTIRGSSFFMAPEVLKREGITGASDIYSLGILIYRILYKKFPFNSFSTINDIKASLASYIELQDSPNSSLLNEAIKISLSAEPEKRYASCIHFLKDIGLELHADKVDAIIPTNYFEKNNLLADVLVCLNTKAGARPIEIFGPIDSGKSSLLKKLENDFENFVLLSGKDIDNKQSFFFVLISKLFANAFIHKHLTQEMKSLIKKQLTNSADLTFNVSNRIISLISNSCSFSLMFDDFGDYDSVTKENIIKLVPFLTAKNIQSLVASETDTFNTKSLLVNSIRFELNTLNNDEAEDFLRSSLSPLLPINEITRIVCTYSDLRIGSIVRMVSKLLSGEYLRIDKFDNSISLETDYFENQLILTNNLELEQTLLKISKGSSDIIDLLALINKPLSYIQISNLLNMELETVRTDITELIQTNLIRYNSFEEWCKISSERIRLIIENKNTQPKSFNIRIANWMINHPDNFNAYDIATQFEKAGEHDSSFLYYFLEYSRAYSNAAFNYAIQILEHILSTPLTPDKQIKIKYELCKAYFKIGKSKECIAVIESLLPLSISSVLRTELLILKGETEIALGLYQPAVDVFEQLLVDSLSPAHKNKTLVCLADANLYLSKYSSVFDICKSLLDKHELSLEDKGKVHNLLALVSLHQDHNFEEAILYLREAIKLFEAANQIDRVAGMKINLGGIYAMQSDYENAKLIWNDALQLNQSIGNLEQEAKLLLNYGVLSYDLCEYDIAKEHYLKSLTIFESAGDLNSIGLTLLNMGEVNFALGLFSEAAACFAKSENLFMEISSFSELAEVLFASAKYYFSIGDLTSLKSTLEKYMHLYNKSLVSNAAKKYESLILGLVSELENKLDAAELLLNKSFADFSESKEREEISNYYFIMFALINNYIRQGKLSQANILADKCLISHSVPQNNILKAEKEYYLGLLTYKFQQSDPTIHLSNCISLLADFPLNLLSAKAFYLSSEYYKNRGNTFKSEKLLDISKSIIEHLSKQFSDKANQINFMSQFEHIFEVG